MLKITVHGAPQPYPSGPMLLGILLAAAACAGWLLVRRRRSDRQ